MVCQLPTDCLNEIFEYLEEYKISLRSCLLVNCLWCEVAVRILWRNIWNFQYSLHYNPYRTHVPLAILSTLIACLPNESKNLLNKNGILIQTPTSKTPLLNYISFIQILSIRRIDQIIEDALKYQPINTLQSLNYNKYLVSQELFKTFMNQISSLKTLDYDLFISNVQNIPFTYFPGAKDCLTDLSLFICNSDIYSEFFYQLSQICHNIQSLSISFNRIISDGLTDLISAQQNLKYLNIYNSNCECLSKIFVPSKLSNNLIKFLENNGKNLKVFHLHLNPCSSSTNLAIAKFCPNLKSLSTRFKNNDVEVLETI